MKTRVKLITGAGGQLAEFSKPKIDLAGYADEHNFDIEFRNYKDNFKLSKLKQILDSLNESYDYVIWVDYDVRVLDKKENIMDSLVNREHNYVWVSEHRIESGNKWKNLLNGFQSFNVPNTGVMVFRSCDESKALIKTMFDYVLEYYHNFYIVDNGAFLSAVGRNKLLSQLYFRHNFKKDGSFIYGILENNFNYVRGKNPYVNYNRPIVFEHYAGVKDREDYLL